MIAIDACSSEVYQVNHIDNLFPLKHGNDRKSKPDHLLALRHRMVDIV